MFSGNTNILIYDVKERQTVTKKIHLNLGDSKVASKFSNFSFRFFKKDLGKKTQSIEFIHQIGYY